MYVNNEYAKLAMPVPAYPLGRVTLFAILAFNTLCGVLFGLQLG